MALNFIKTGRWLYAVQSLEVSDTGKVLQTEQYYELLEMEQSDLTSRRIAGSSLLIERVEIARFSSNVTDDEVWAELQRRSGKQLEIIGSKAVIK